MSDIQTILDHHSIEVQGLLRKHKIAGELEIGTIRKAYDQKGEPFMMDLLQIITPTSSFLGIGKGNGFLGLGKAKEESFAYDPLADPLSDEYYNAAIASPSAATTGGGWNFWDKLLNNVSKTGDTISKVKGDLSGQSAANTALLNSQAQQETSNSNMLYFVAAGFVALIIIILILKK